MILLTPRLMSLLCIWTSFSLSHALMISGIATDIRKLSNLDPAFHVARGDGELQLFHVSAWFAW